MERRRGAALEGALLEAAWAELADQGYARFTMDAVATRAGTSTPVLYRRWANKQELLRAAIKHTAHRVLIEIPDTGSLRTDMLALLREANGFGAGIFTMLTVQLGVGFFRDAETSPAELIEEFGPELPLLRALDAVYRRAADRGEVEIGRLTPRMRTLPFDLLRSELMMTLKPAPDAVLEEIIDELYLPLVR